MAFSSIRRRFVYALLKLLPIISFVVPISMLYLLFSDSFESTWKGRSYYLIFLWLVTMEVILNWKTVNEGKNLKSLRAVVLVIASVIPSVYVIYANFFELNNVLVTIAQTSGIHFYWMIPLSIEYVTFAALFGILVATLYGVKGLEDFSVPISLLAIIGTIYTIDDVYPYGRFTPLQIVVPTTVTLAAGFLNFLGYQTSFIGFFENTPVLQAWNTTGSATFGIAWPCAGVDGLIIYSVAILLFLKRTSISRKNRLVYFVIGAVVTYFINILRIAVIFIIAAEQGNYLLFHDYYGQMFTIIWIVSYMLLITATQHMHRNRIIARGSTPLLSE